MFKESPVIPKDITSFKGSCQGIAPKTRLRPYTSFRPVDQKYIIVSVSFINMGTFVSKPPVLLLLNDDPGKASFLRSRQIRRKLKQMDIRISVGHIDSSVIVKKQRTVMIIIVIYSSLPGSLNPGCPEEISPAPVCVACEHDIKAAVMIAKTGGPHTTGVIHHLLIQALARRIVKLIK